jgi:hypothetical protein
MDLLKQWMEIILRTRRKNVYNFKFESKAQLTLYTLVAAAQHDFLFIKYLPYRYCRVLHRFASYLFEELYK